MTDEQFARWEDFATRLARHGFPEWALPCQGQVVDAVEQFFYGLDEGDWRAWAGYEANEPGQDPVRDTHRHTMYLCDYLSECHQKLPGYWGLSEEQYEDWWLTGAIESCIRASADVIGVPSTGVLGFTVGDLRRMWDGEPPEWLVGWFDSGDLATAPDSAGVWL